MRVGIIVKLIAEKKFGFIRTDHFRDDVFFHQSSLQGLQFRHLIEGMEVEFEINEILRLDEQKLEATLVQEASRPLSKSLAELPLRHVLAAHHPRARQKKPTWRERKEGEDAPSTDTPTHEELSRIDGEHSKIESGNEVSQSPVDIGQMNEADVVSSEEQAKLSSIEEQSLNTEVAAGTENSESTENSEEIVDGLPNDSFPPEREKSETLETQANAGNGSENNDGNARSE